MSEDRAEVKRKLEYGNGASRDPEIARGHDEWAKARGRRRERERWRDDRTLDAVEAMERGEP